MNLILPVILVPLSIILINSIELKGAMISLIVVYSLKAVFGYSILIKQNDSFLKAN